MLSPRNRMRRSADFDLTMRKGRRAGRDALTVVLFVPRQHRDERDEAQPPRVGFIVSKAVGGAVVRKRVQRRLRHLMRDRIASLSAGSLLVVRAKPASALLGYDALATQLDSALSAVARPRGRSAGRSRTPRGAATANVPAAGERPSQ
ncbi:ribonuclease P protein component [Thermobifida halotolerans]|uniref:Ribonuclease P protein component n=1 Tax=Thermobifida halotolerans TaxID=483545 RepID=A0AA97LVL6_9ACTN|nr:ribonuclease P protein component [Thermobifida halotolerans]UOE18993.1 ribonuclease P protein component [Thermobifida halotolerans]